jgi:hypothetical protein
MMYCHIALTCAFFRFMKILKLLCLAITMLVMAFGLSSCKKDFLKRSIWVKTGLPVEDVRNSFAVEPPREITHPAGVYRSGNLLFLLEQGEGIGITDISDRENPVPKCFIKLLANSHAVVKYDHLIADNGVDLVSIDISDLSNISLVKRVTNVFKEKWLEQDKTIFTGYEEKKISTFKSYNPSDTIPPAGRTTESTAAIAIGKGGSETRFAVQGDFLYIARGNALTPVDLYDPSDPIVHEEVGYRDENTFETVFAYQGYLYIGTSDGVLILNSAKSPITPYFESFASRNVRGCDPVVVQNNFMFSTIRTGTVCNRFGNSALFIHDVSNKTIPFGIYTENVESPRGLGIDGNLLFLCQADKGLAVYNWNEATKKLTYRYQKPEIYAFDVITGSNTLIVAADNGLYLYDYTDPNNIRKLSRVARYEN